MSPTRRDGEAAEVAVVGAGPAGLAAAVAAAGCGARVALIDEAAAPGGQIWRPGSGERLAPPVRERMARAEQLGVELIPGTLAWAATSDRALLLAPVREAPGLDDRSECWAIRPRAIVLATGAHDRPFPFPGWTLPGVMTAGGLQALAKADGLRPGTRVLLAGAGPFLLPVACALLDAGAEIVAVAEATRRRSWMRSAGRIRHAPGRLAQLARYETRLARARVPRLFGHVIRHAHPDGPAADPGAPGEPVARVELGRVDGDWLPLEGGVNRSFEVDAVGIGYGFQPNFQLARLLGCRLVFADRERQFVVWRDESTRTSVPFVFAAGEVAGIGGAELAESEGVLAGVAAAAAVGHRDKAPRRTRRVRRRTVRLRRFADLLVDLFAPPTNALGLISLTTEVCRCEGVTRGDLEWALRQPAIAPTVRGLKGATRIAMGPCQGSTCGQLVALLTAEHTGQAADQVELPSSRPPTKPMALGALAALARGDES